tara:strand:- start:276 stop:500 length:225 start_codon:yes stop_codon:yes gene_type:complete
MENIEEILDEIIDKTAEAFEFQQKLNRALSEKIIRLDGEIGELNEEMNKLEVLLNNLISTLSKELDIKEIDLRY